jgi:hypothetical protein
VLFYFPKCKNNFLSFNIKGGSNFYELVPYENSELNLDEIQFWSRYWSFSLFYIFLQISIFSAPGRNMGITFLNTRPSLAQIACISPEVCLFEALFDLL